MTNIRILAGGFQLVGRLEENLAPRTCEFFRSMMPLRQNMIHVRWSGEGCWIPLGEMGPGIPFENTTDRPAPGQFIFYPGGISEVEILLAYGSVRFSSRAGRLEGNHFLTITQGVETLRELGQRALWHGAQDISFEFLPAQEKFSPISPPSVGSPLGT
jgi:hypothetical protein